MCLQPPYFFRPRLPVGNWQGVCLCQGVVYMPARAVNPMTIPSAKPIASYGSARATKTIILLVEDESIVREVTREVLERAGYCVLESDGPQEALRLATEHQGRIQLLLSDVVMPGMNGPDLARHLQELQPGLTTVFMSGYANRDVLQNVMGHSSGIYVQKPFSVDILLARVAEALQTKAGTAGAPKLSGFPA